jgi:membrane associated rhomboid family serine protease
VKETRRLRRLKEAVMRKVLFWFGCAVFCALPIIYVTQIWVTQDLPGVEGWKWAILAAAIVLIYFTRSHDDVLKHHLV